MFKLNRDVLCLIFEELQDDNKALYSCLLVNKTWCITAVPILWKNPWKNLDEKKEELMSDVIISHLSDETKNNLENQGIDFLTSSYQKPLFYYISFCKHLNLIKIQIIVDIIYTKKSIIRDEIYNLFINKNTKFTHLYIPEKFSHEIH